jgi:hypothetical protein
VDKASSGRGLNELLLPEQSEDYLPFVLLRLALLVGLLMYTIGLLGGIRDDMGSLLHLVNLPFHEAGHVIFGLLGNQFLMSLGGMLGQLLMPMVCAGVFLLQQRDVFAAAVALWWFSENFVDLAPYIRDASIGELPLLGGNTGQHAPYGFHDFAYLLTETGLIAFDQRIANLSYWLGCLWMLGCIGWGGFILWQQYQSCQRQRR